MYAVVPTAIIPLPELYLFTFGLPGPYLIFALDLILLTPSYLPSELGIVGFFFYFSFRFTSQHTDSHTFTRLHYN